MLDQQIKGSEEIDEMKSNTSNTTNTTSSGSESLPIKKTCSDCGTNRTPLWRGGPAGPKSLCNACGIRSRKRRRALLGLTNPDSKKKPNNNNNKCKKSTVNTFIDDGSGSNCGGGGNGSGSGSGTTSEISGDEKMCSDHVMKMEGLTWRRSTAGKKWRRGSVVLGEEEQAAVLLMAMAYSSVFV